MCATALYVLLALFSAGVPTWPIGRCAIVAVMNVSAYTDASGDGLGVTASGLQTQHGIVAAGPHVPYATSIFIAGYGAGRVADRGGAITDGHVDIWMSEDAEAWRWGRQRLPVVMFWEE